MGIRLRRLARIVLCSDDTVIRVLKGFLNQGLDGLLRGTSSGRGRIVTGAWESELMGVIEVDPHDVGVMSANWTTQLLADYLEGRTGLTLSRETVRLYLHAYGYVCKRPTWTRSAQS